MFHDKIGGGGWVWADGFLIPRFCRADLGCMFYFGLANLGNCQRISQRILMAIFFRKFFGLVFFPGFQAPRKKSRPRFTPRIVGIPLQFHFLEPKCFFVHADFLLTGEIKVLSCILFARVRGEMFFDLETLFFQESEILRGQVLTTKKHKRCNPPATVRPSTL